MSVVHQLVDVVVAGLLAGITAFLVSAIDPSIAVTMGVILACMYYFSRNPWGSQDGEKYNERIDEVYDRWLPF